ncbi:hypothetical protein F383_01698 [Gossypium arboreum]|uniref:Uncharacterized protein n=1 Tax=Gossypium arboreum TaxID=29729 RepID=A0A0B0PF31_GOSAR|nr:hypothetical protein F383_01698 [Gossypium arboreum]
MIDIFIGFVKMHLGLFAYCVSLESCKLGHGVWFIV